MVTGLRVVAANRTHPGHLPGEGGDPGRVGRRSEPSALLGGRGVRGRARFVDPEPAPEPLSVSGWPSPSKSGASPVVPPWSPPGGTPICPDRSRHPSSPIGPPGPRSPQPVSVRVVVPVVAAPSSPTAYPAPNPAPPMASPATTAPAVRTLRLRPRLRQSRFAAGSSGRSGVASWPGAWRGPGGGGELGAGGRSCRFLRSWWRGSARSGASAQPPIGPPRPPAGASPATTVVAVPSTVTV